MLMLYDKERGSNAKHILFTTFFSISGTCLWRHLLQKMLKFIVKDLCHLLLSKLSAATGDQCERTLELLSCQILRKLPKLFKMLPNNNKIKEIFFEIENIVFLEWPIFDRFWITTKKSKNGILKDVTSFHKNLLPNFLVLVSKTLTEATFLAIIKLVLNGPKCYKKPKC